MVLTTAVGISLTLLALYLVKAVVLDRKTNGLPLPPGPKGLPVVGNITDLPPEGVPEFEHWAKHIDRYGPLSSVTVLGQTMIFIHSRELAQELLEKRASKYSERPYMKFGYDLLGWADSMPSLPYNQTLRLYRRYAYQQLGTKSAVSRYYPLQQQAVGRFLTGLNRDKGANLTQHVKNEATEVVLKILYGYNIEPHSADPLVHIADLGMDHFSEAMVPGRWAVDAFPALEYLPAWMPGAGSKRTAQLWQKNLNKMINVGYDFAKQQMSCGQNRDSFVTKSIEQARKDTGYGPNEEHDIKWAAQSLLAGGADTSVSTIEGFFLAMSMFPDVQRKAQEEIDRVIGTSRLPSFSDREQLPYINAIVEEAQRWHPIAVMGLPHAADQEDVVNGYRIPKGAVLIASIWWLTRDPQTYHDPEAFIPERYTEPYNELPATNFTFGFGRRICPGKVLADANLFLTFAQSLAVFNIRKALDDQGKEIEPVHTFSAGVIGRPGPFGARITPRSSQHENLIKQVVAEYPWEEGDAKHLKGIEV